MPTLTQHKGHFWDDGFLWTRRDSNPQQCLYMDIAPPLRVGYINSQMVLDLLSKAQRKVLYIVSKERPYHTYLLLLQRLILSWIFDKQLDQKGLDIPSSLQNFNVKSTNVDFCND